ncbi:MAG: histidine--tRNA ligase [Bacteroidales bacterium]|jgi:histidyl-tRNA synthetase|nr:histidine--tRNA ligase [Bacteroidales bacterium]
MIKPSIPKGTRDFAPEIMVKRNFIFDTIKHVFNLYGYMPIETPAMENLSTLLGKYGEEGDKLIFRILNSGDFLSKTDKNDLDNINSFTNKISEKGLRYDLTVPFARFVVMNRNEIVFPFKRYQIQTVWRADRPQKGRYREFYQCDVDIVGSKSLLNEFEFVLMINDVFNRLGIKVTIKINNRKILSGIASYIGYADKLTDITVAIDKIDKTGYDNVVNELLEKGISEEGIQKLTPILNLKGSSYEKIESLKSILSDSEEGLLGIEEIKTLFDYIKTNNLESLCELDLTLARGLSYYTGAIFEVKANDVSIGSICGGGRYDNLTSIFGLNDVSGVGISFGAERIYDVMNELNLFPTNSEQTTQVLILNLGNKEVEYCFPLIHTLRRNEINTELYPETAKMKKQMEYANKRNIPFVIIVGENEITANIVSVKNMNSGEQINLSFSDCIEYIKKHSNF